jgi:maltose-binding protein MalE
MRKYLSICLLAVLSSFLVHPSSAADELRIVYTYGEGHLGKILERFAEQEGVKLRAEFQVQNELKSTIMALLEMNAVPDAIIMPGDHVGLYRFTGYSKLSPSLFKAKIPARVWETTLSEGNYYGAPLVQGNHLLLFYNKQMVEEPAADWQTMRQHHKELQAKGLYAISWSYGEPFWFLPFLGAYGGWPIVNGEVNLNTPAMVKALDFYKGLRTDGLIYPSCSYECGIDVFETGKVAYTINGDWESRNLQRALGDNLGVAALPKVEGKKMVSTFSTQVVAFPKGSLDGPKRATLIKLVNYLQSPPVQRQLWEEIGGVPVEASAFAYAEERTEGFAKEIISLMAETKPLPADSAMTFIWDAISKGYIRHQEGVMSAERAAQYMQRLAERYLRNVEAQVDAEKPSRP